MNQKLDSLFAEHKEPTHCSTSTVRDRVAPIVDLLADVKAQLGLYRRFVVAAENSEHHPDLDPKLNYLNNTIDGLDAAALDVLGKWRALSMGMGVLDRIMAEARIDVANVAARENATADVVNVAGDAIPATETP